MTAMLKGKVAIVTGASRGIGLATVRALAQAGARVVVAGRDGTRCDAVASALRGEGLQARAAPCDVAEEASVAALFADTERHEWPPDILVNNAGVIEPIARIAEADPAAWAQSLQVNVAGAFYATRCALRIMLPRGGGTIVNLSSSAARRAMEGWSAYCVGKAALAMLTASTHHEYAASGIRVFGFAPGVVDTDMQASIRRSGMNEVSRLPRESLAAPEQPARAIAWLCSAEADDLQGQEIDLRDPGLRRRAGLPL